MKRGGGGIKANILPFIIYSFQPTQILRNLCQKVIPCPLNEERQLCAVPESKHGLKIQARPMLQISASTATSVYKFDGACPLIIPAGATTIHLQEQNCDTAYSNTFSFFFLFSPPKKNKLRTSLEKHRFAGVSTRGVKAALHRREEAALVHPTGAVLLRGTWPCCTPLLPLALRDTLPFFVPPPTPLEGKAAPFSVAQYLGCSEQPPPRVVATRSNAQHSPPCDAAADAASRRRG